MGNRVKSVVAYCRVSTDQQADSGLSIEAQREQLVSFTIASGLELVGLFIDAGISGAKDETERPGLREALAAIHERRADALVVSKRDRLARDMSLAGYIETMIRRAGAELIVLDEQDVSPIDEAACEDFGLYMKEKQKAPPTVNFALRLLRKVLHHARRRKIIAYDAMPESFHLLKETMLKLEMNDSEQNACVAAFDDEVGFREDLNARQKRSGKVVRSPRFGFKERRFGGGLKSDSEAAGIYFERFRHSRLIFVAALDLGLSETDLRLLKRSSVDLTNGRVEVVRAKTKKVATIALSDRCRAAIVEALSQAITSSEYVFTTETGKPYSESTLRRYFAIAKRLAGITRRCRLTDLRHTFASNLINDGIPSIVVRDALGHADVRMTQRYAKPSAHALEQMRASLNRRGQRAIMPDAEADTSKDGLA